jgi:hypothetical protein
VRSVLTHRWLNDDSVLHGESLHYRVSPGPVWSDMMRVYCPSRHPHGSQCACHDRSGTTMMHRARNMARSEAADGWTVSGKVSTGEPPFIVVHCVKATRAAPGERKGGDSSVRRQSERALTRHRGAVAMGVAWRAHKLGVVRMLASGWSAGERGIQVSTRCIEGRQHNAPTRLRTRTRAVLHRGVDSVLSAVSARPAEWAT